MIITIGALNIYLYRPQMAGSGKKEDISAQIGNAIDNKGLIRDTYIKNIEGIIKTRSEQFIEAVFAGNQDIVNKMLDDTATFIKNADGSSFIRHINDVNHVEGYMATDSAFEAMNQKWCIVSNEGSVLCCMEIRISENSEPIYWYLHFRKSAGAWRLYMLENDI
jgi:hypothetical protein